MTNTSPFLSLFQAPSLTQTELDVAAQCLNNDSVKKYLKMLGWMELHSLATISASNMTAVDVANAHIAVTGRLEVLTTLLSVEYKQIIEE